MRRILILTAGFGDGHNTAAGGLREALEASGEPVRVEIVDLLQYSYGVANQLARMAYHGLIQHAPTLWGGIFCATDRVSRCSAGTPLLNRAKRGLAQLLSDARPDAVLSTYPAYGSLVQALYPDERQRPFQFGVVVTDSITVHASWYAAPADFFLVPNPETAAVLRGAGVPAERVYAPGFPVHPRFGGLGPAEGDWESGNVFRVLYILNHGIRKAAKTVRCLRRLEGIHLTVVTGRNQRLRGRLQRLTEGQTGRLEVLGWTDQMPELMRRSHLVVTKAGGATVQEALAAGKPVVLTQVVPGQEEGNARLVTSLGLGAVAGGPKLVARVVSGLLKGRGAIYRRWRQRVERRRRPNAASACARLVLERCAEAEFRSVVRGRLQDPTRVGIEGVSPPRSPRVLSPRGSVGLREPAVPFGAMPGAQMRRTV